VEIVTTERALLAGLCVRGSAGMLVPTKDTRSPGTPARDASGPSRGLPGGPRSLASEAGCGEQVQVACMKPSADETAEGGEGRTPSRPADRVADSRNVMAIWVDSGADAVIRCALSRGRCSGPSAMNHSGPSYWYRALDVSPRKYTCAFCGNLVSSSLGFRRSARQDGSGAQIAAIYICPHCQEPTYVNDRGQALPGEPFGAAVEHLPEDVQALYDEARRASAAGCPTAAVLLCRKLLMCIAVTEGAETNRRFIKYVDYLDEQGYIPPNGKRWVQHIRRKSNEASHEIKIMESDDAAELIWFSEMLLRFIYEFPSLVPA
ncbi:MAG: DUF4145 domain-containing protein, partial [Planctomycetota bacterium]